MHFGRSKSRLPTLPRVIGTLLIVAAAVVLSAPGTPAASRSPQKGRSLTVEPASPVDARAAAEAQALVVLTNRLRASVGVPNLAVRDDLTLLACEWAETLAEKNTLEHSPFIFDRDLFTSRMGREWALAGENVGSGSDIYAVHGALVGSPLHYRNLVNEDFTHVGICVRRRANGTAFVAQEFLAPKKHK